MQGGVDALRYLRCVVGSIQEAVDVAALVRPRQEIVETPHVKFPSLTAEILIAHIRFSHRIYLCVSD